MYPQWNEQRRPGHYNYFRDYDPAIGRYIQSDSIGLLGGGNTYSYVEGNPVRLIDPLGLAASGSHAGDCVANCIREERFDLEKALCTLVTTLGVGKMPKTSSEKRGGFGPKDKHSPWTSQASRWQRRDFWPGGRAFGQSMGGGALGGAATALLIGEGFYDIGAIGRCLLVCAADSSSY